MHFVTIQPVGIRFRQSSGPPARRGSVPDAQPVRLRTSVRSFAERGPRLARVTSESHAVSLSNLPAVSLSNLPAVSLSNP